VVTDDSVGESTREFIEGGHWPRPVRYQRNPNRHDRGRSNFNLCFSLARGEFVKFLCDDDVLTPNCVERMVDVITRHPGVALVTSRRQRVDAEGMPLEDRESTLAPLELDALIEGASLSRAMLTSMVNFVGEPSTPLFRRADLLNESGDILSYCGERITFVNDIAMWLTILHHGDAAFLIEQLSGQRVHSGQNQNATELQDQSLGHFKNLCEIAKNHGVIDDNQAAELGGRPRWVPGWAQLKYKNLEQPTAEWQEASIYFGPERIAKGARSAQLSADELALYSEFCWTLYAENNPEPGETEANVTDHFLQHGQFEYRVGVPRYAHDASRMTRQCTQLWNQLLVDDEGNARPCPRFSPLLNVYSPDITDGLDSARLHFLTGRPQGPCADCDRHPKVPLADFVRHNFSSDHDLLKARKDRVLISEKATTSVSPRHVLVIGHSAGRAGGEYVALSIVRGLHEDLGCQVTVILARGGELTEQFRQYAQVHVLGDKTLPGTEAQRELLIQLRQRGVRHAICNTVVVGRYAKQLKELGYQVTHLVHELGTSIENFLPAEDRLGVCDHTDALIFPVNFVKSSFLEHYAPRTDTLLCRPQGIEPDFPRPQDRGALRQRLRNSLGLASDTRLVIGAGSGELRKGPDLFAQVAKRVLAGEGSSAIHFVWLGQLDKVLESWIEHDRHLLGLDRQFHLAGLQSDLTDYYLGADVFLMTSREDPLPNVVIESMYAGLPVIAFAEGGGTPELLVDGCGVIVPYLDVDAMASATRRLLDTPEEAQNIATRAAQRIDSGFRRADYVSYLLARFTAPVHTVTLVVFGQDAAALSAKLHSLSLGLTTNPWRPDAVLTVSPVPTNDGLPGELMAIPVSHLILPAKTSADELLRQAASRAETELLWFVDVVTSRINDDFPNLISAFDSPSVVAAFGPGHHPAQRDALAPIPRALLSVNERAWFSPHWGNDSHSALRRSTPLLALSSGLIRRTAIGRVPPSPAALKKNPLWVWPWLAGLSRIGTMVWTPRPTVDLVEDDFPGNNGQIETWFSYWEQARGLVDRLYPAEESRASNRDDDWRQLRSALELPEQSAKRTSPQIATRVSASAEKPPMLSPQKELSLYNKAAHHLDNGRIDKGKEQLLDLASQGSMLWQVYFDLGRIAFEEEKVSDAEGYFRQAASLEFSSTHSLHNLVAIFTMKQEYAQALATIGIILRREDDPQLVEHLRAIVTEAGVSLDSLDWISPRYAEQAKVLIGAESRLTSSLDRIENLEKQLLLKNAGLVGDTSISQPTQLRVQSPGYCVLCKSDVASWLPWKAQIRRSPFVSGLGSVGSNVEQFWCPKCRSHDRERHLMLYLQATNLLETFHDACILHVAPEANLSKVISEQKPRRYVLGDLHPASKEIELVDVENLSYPDDSFDWVLCNHVLEHVTDYRRALSELRRVLRPGGRLICQTPYAEKLSVTFEEKSLSSDEERFLYYGQEDHVRLFGNDIESIIQSAGFVGSLQSHKTLIADIDPQHYGVNEREPFFLFVK
jgi:glycosyltransferase involved in cell wall biosynthesis/tetratricopeptide (TPR) repeat protein